MKEKTNTPIRDDIRDYSCFFDSIFCIRLIALLWIIFLHIFNEFTSFKEEIGPFFNIIFFLGDIGLDILLFISGMILTFQIATMNYDDHCWKSWYKKRILKIYPLLIISTFFYVFFHYIVNDEIFSLNSVIVHISGLQAFQFNDLNMIFYIEPTHWFISFILFLYLLFPIFYVFIKKNLKISFICLIISFSICIILLFTMKIFTDSLFYFDMFVIRIFIFIFGMLFGFWLSSNFKKKEKMMKNHIIGLTLFILIILSFFIFINIKNMDDHIHFSIERQLYFPLLTIIFLLFLNYIFINLPKTGNSLKFFGKISYGLYLVHNFIILVNAVIFFKLINNLIFGIELFYYLIPLIIFESILLSVPFYYFEIYIRKKYRYHILILTISISLILYGIASFILDINYTISDYLALFIYLIVLLTTISIMILYKFCKEK